MVSKARDAKHSMMYKIEYKKIPYQNPNSKNDELMNKHLEWSNNARQQLSFANICARKMRKIWTINLHISLLFYKTELKWVHQSANS